MNKCYVVIENVKTEYGRIEEHIFAIHSSLEGAREHAMIETGEIDDCGNDEVRETLIPDPIIEYVYQGISSGDVLMIVREYPLQD